MQFIASQVEWFAFWTFNSFQNLWIVNVPGEFSYCQHDHLTPFPTTGKEEERPPRVLRLLGQRFGRQERLWGNGIFSIFLIGYSGNNEIGEAEVGSM